LLIALAFCLNLIATFWMKTEKEILQAKLASQQRIINQYKALAAHRDKQINELHLLISSHNERVENDEAKLENFHKQQEALNYYTETKMLGRDDVCLELGDVERLRGAWDAFTNPDPR